MKKFCLICERTSFHDNLYCQEVYCPAEMSPTVLDYGEWLGDIEIMKPLVLLRSSIVYAAQQHKQPILLKVAHPGVENTERIKREAHVLKNMQVKHASRSLLPVLRSPYADATVATHPYGRAMLRDQLLYFCVYDYFEGEPLRDLLTKTPQPWINHVGWITTNLTQAIAILQNHGIIHGNLNPDSLLVHFDTNNISRVLLIDLGAASELTDVKRHWSPVYAHPAYTAPEILKLEEVHRLGYETDVYGIGLTMYEMLIGKPAFTFKLQSDAEVYDAILDNRRASMSREEDVIEVANLASRAVTQKPSRRFANAVDFEQALIEIFGKVPEKKPPRRWLSMHTTPGKIVILLALAFIITAGVIVWEALS